MPSSLIRQSLLTLLKYQTLDTLFLLFKHAYHVIYELKLARSVCIEFNSLRVVYGLYDYLDRISIEKAYALCIGKNAKYSPREHLFIQAIQSLSLNSLEILLFRSRLLMLPIPDSIPFQLSKYHSYIWNSKKCLFMTHFSSTPSLKLLILENLNPKYFPLISFYFVWTETELDEIIRKCPRSVILFLVAVTNPSTQQWLRLVNLCPKNQCQKIAKESIIPQPAMIILAKRIMKLDNFKPGEIVGKSNIPIQIWLSHVKPGKLIYLLKNIADRLELCNWEFIFNTCAPCHIYIIYQICYNNTEFQKNILLIALKRCNPFNIPKILYGCYWMLDSNIYQLILEKTPTIVFYKLDFLALYFPNNTKWNRKMSISKTCYYFRLYRKGIKVK